MNLKDFKFFNELKDKAFWKEFRIISYHREEIIFDEGNECHDLSFILNGEVSIRTYSLNGKEEIINNLKEGDIFGDILSYSHNNLYIGHVIANKFTTIAHINKQKWLTILQNNQTILESFLKSITDKMLKTKMENKLLAHKNIEDRLYYYLNSQINKNKNQIVIIKSVTDLAMILNLPRPSVSRALSNMEKKGIIKHNNKRIEVIN